MMSVEILAELYATSGGAGWTNNTGWLSGGPCTPPLWAGVTCSFAGEVTSLDLLSNNLVGTLTPTLANLTALGTLKVGKRRDASTNWNCDAAAADAISGTLPTQFGLLTELNILSAACTSLSGSLPTELANAAQLTLLRLVYNSMSGTVPSQLGNVSSLVTVRQRPSNHRRPSALPLRTHTFHS